VPGNHRKIKNKRRIASSSSSRSSSPNSEPDTRKRSYSSSSGSSDKGGQRAKTNYDPLKDVLPGEARLMRNQKTKINQMLMSTSSC